MWTNLLLRLGWKMINRDCRKTIILSSLLVTVIYFIFIKKSSQVFVTFCSRIHKCQALVFYSHWRGTKRNVYSTHLKVSYCRLSKSSLVMFNMFAPHNRQESTEFCPNIQSILQWRYKSNKSDQVIRWTCTVKQDIS